MIHARPLDPQAKDDFTWRWNADWLGTATISTFTPTVVDGGVLVVASGISGNLTTARISGNNAITGTYAHVLGHVVLSDGREDEETIEIPIRSL